MIKCNHETFLNDICLGCNKPMYSCIIDLRYRLEECERRLNIACHIKADDKVGFDLAVLDRLDDQANLEVARLQAENDALRNDIENLQKHHDVVVNEYLSQIDRLAKKLEKVREYIKQHSQFEGFRILMELTK